MLEGGDYQYWLQAVLAKGDAATMAMFMAVMVAIMRVWGLAFRHEVDIDAKNSHQSFHHMIPLSQLRSWLEGTIA